VTITAFLCCYLFANFILNLSHLWPTALFVLGPARITTAAANKQRNIVCFYTVKMGTLLPALRPLLIELSLNICLLPIIARLSVCYSSVARVTHDCTPVELLSLRYAWVHTSVELRHGWLHSDYTTVDVMLEIGTTSATVE